MRVSQASLLLKYVGGQTRYHCCFLIDLLDVMDFVLVTQVVLHQFLTLLLDF